MELQKNIKHQDPEALNDVAVFIQQIPKSAKMPAETEVKKVMEKVWI